MTKEEVLKELFKLNREDILDIEQIIHGYAETTNKCSEDTILIRCLFAKGCHSTKEFYKKNGITKDHSLATTIFKGSNSLKAYMDLKEVLSIDDETFLSILERVKSGKYE